MLFESCGPFYLDRRKLESWGKRAFWQEVDTYWPSLSSAVGCYAFCLESQRGVAPWYVGKTIAQNGFKGEVFQEHKINHYQEIVRPTFRGRKFRTGKPCILLFPLVTKNFTLSKNRSSSDAYIDWLETTLIGMALSASPDIANTSKTRFHRDVYVHGLIGNQFSGRPSDAAQYAKRAFLR